MRVGVIDLGANSAHLAILQVWEDLTHSQLHQERTQIRLGAPVFEQGAIDPQTISKTISTLHRFQHSCRNYEVDVVRVVATSALREAENSAEVIERIKSDTGLDVVVISGKEEARLTSLAATESLGMTKGKVLVMDVGGGTTEVAWVEEGVPKQLWSFHLGPVRALLHVNLADPPGMEGLDALRAVARKSLAPVARAKLGPPDCTLATSGTALCLGELCGVQHRASTGLETHVVFRTTLRNFLERLAEMPLEKRRDWLGIHAERADTLLIGGMIFLVAMEDLGLDTFITGGKALRAGIVIDLLHREVRSSARDRSARLQQLSKQGGELAEVRDVRIHTILSLARRYGYDAVHSAKVLEFANHLFDGLSSLSYWLGEEDRFYLQAAALLHDIGYYINTTRHHHHSQYLVMHSDIEGFHQMEIRIIANLVRYHSREMPGPSNPDYGSLSDEMKQKVDLLAGILRIADALDFSHQGLIDKLSVRVDPERILIGLEARGPIDLEIQEAIAKGNLLAKALNRKVEIRGG
jgi:exopolyphosphatase/guanosine-5'-triphosphate,3'-diphosphate pyrophosphatase